MKSLKLLAALPPLYLFLSFITFGIILHTKASSILSGQRAKWLPLFLLLSIASLLASKHFVGISQSYALTSLWTQAVTLYILHVGSVLFIEGWYVPSTIDEESRDIATGKRDDENRKTCVRQWLTQKLYTTYRLWGNPQLLHVQSVLDRDGRPQFRGVQRNVSRTTQQRTTVFLLRGALKLAIYYYLHNHLIPTIVSHTVGDIMPGDVGYKQQILLRRLNHLTPREAVVRAYTAVSWIWESVIFLDGANAALSILFVSTGLDKPSDWPSLFGSPSSITSLSKFWSSFWHQIATRPYKNYGRILAQRIFQLEPRSISSNIIIAFIVFSLSGITHAVTVWQCGLKDWHLEIHWFMLNFLGCFIERAFVTCFRSIAKHILHLSKDKIRKIEKGRIGRTVGFVWVFAFFFWSVPKWKYPRIEMEVVARERFRGFLARLQGH